MDSFLRRSAWCSEIECQLVLVDLLELRYFQSRRPARRLVCCFGHGFPYLPGPRRKWPALAGIRYPWPLVSASGSSLGSGAEIAPNSPASGPGPRFPDRPHPRPSPCRHWPRTLRTRCEPPRRVDPRHGGGRQGRRSTVGNEAPNQPPNPPAQRRSVVWGSRSWLLVSVVGLGVRRINRPHGYSRPHFQGRPRMLKDVF